MSYNVKNYTEQGGEVTHIGGKLIIEEGAQVEGLDGGSYTLPTASADTLGGVKAKAKDAETVEVAVDEDGKLYVPAVPKIAHQAASEASEVADLVSQFNALLTALQTAGLMEAE